MVEGNPAATTEMRDAAALTGAARGGGLNIVGALCNQAALLVLVTIIARTLGEGDLGRYALGLAILTLLGLLALFGFQMSLTRFIAMRIADADPARIRGTVRLGVGLSLSVAIALAVALALSANILASALDAPEFASCLRLVALTLPAAVLRDAALAATQGWSSQRAFALISWVFEPVVRLAMTAALLLLGYGLIGAFVALALGSWAAAGLAVRALLKRLRTLPRAAPIIEVRAILSFSFLSWGTVLASGGLIWADTLLLGALSDSASVGVYNVATRLVNLAVFVMVPVNAAFAPQFAHLWHANLTEALHQAYAASSTWILRLSLPAFVILTIFPAQLLHLFGEGFSTGAHVTVILCVGQLVNAATGPCGTLLNMSGHNGVNMANNIVVLVLNIGLNLWLIPSHGMVGAAIAWSASLAIVNLSRLAQVHYYLGVMPFGIGAAKGIVAASAAAVAGLVLRSAFTSAALELWVGGAACVLTYVAVLLILRLEPTDKTMLRNLLARR